MAKNVLLSEDMRAYLGASALKYLTEHQQPGWKVEQSTTGSIYITLPQGRIRISDHLARGWYHFRWFLWLNKVGYGETSDAQGRVSHHYGLNELERMRDDIMEVVLHERHTEGVDTADADQDAASGGSASYPDGVDVPGSG